MARKSRRNNSISVDLSGVETNRKAIPEGQYTVVVNTAEHAESQSGNPMIKFEFEVTEGAQKGAKLYENCSLQPQALFKLKSLLLGLGFEIPKKAFELDLEELVGLTCDVEVGHEKYEGKTRARILSYLDPNEEDDDEDDDEEEDDEDDGPDLSDLTLDELKELATELGLPKKKWSKIKKAAELADFITEEADNDDLEEAMSALKAQDDDDDDDDDPDYEAMSLKELKEECASRGIRVKKGMDKGDLVSLLQEDDET